MQRVSTLLPCLTIGLVAIHGISPQAIAQAGSGALTIGSEVALEGDPSLTFKLEGVSYAIGWPAADTSMTPAADQKIVVLAFSLRNDSAVDISSGGPPVRLTLIDSLGRGWQAPERFRLLHTVEDGVFLILPGSEVSFYTGIIVPNSANLTGLRVQRNLGNGGVATYDVAGKIAPFVAALRDPSDPSGTTARAEINATTGTWYPLGQLDVRVDGLRIHREEVAVNALGEDQSHVEVLMTVRSRAASSFRFTIGRLAASRAIDADALQINPYAFLARTTDRKVDMDLTPEQEVTGRLMFEILNEPALEEVRVREVVNGGGRTLVFADATGFSLPGIGASSVSAADLSRSTADARTAGRGSFPIGVYDPYAARLFAMGPVPSSAGGVSALTPDAPTIVDERPPPKPATEEPAVAADESATADAGAGSDEPVYEAGNRNFMVDIQRVTIENNNDLLGDEPWLIVMEFRGRMGESSPPPQVFSPDNDVAMIGPNNWGKKGESRLVPDLTGNRPFSTVRPYEVFGVVLVALERETATDARRRELAGQAYKQAYSRWQTFMSGTREPDLSDLSRSRVIEEADRVIERFATAFWKGLPERIHDTIRPGLGVYQEQVVGTRGIFWINVPGLSNTEIADIAQTKVDLAESPGALDKSFRNWFFEPGTRDLRTEGFTGVRRASWLWRVAMP